MMVEGKKRKIRRMRVAAMENDDGSVSSHRMVWSGDPAKKRGEYGVSPSIAPKKGKETSTNKDDWEKQSPEEAREKGEFVSVKSKRKAKKLAGGSWKKGLDKREAMREFRRNKQK